MDETILLVDYLGRRIRLTPERLDHIRKHPEVEGQLERIHQTLAQPDAIVETIIDETVHVYHRFYEKTPVTSKHMHVVVKVTDDAFVLSAFYSNRRKKGRTIWEK